ncbi:MAG: calcium-binding protein, partial [Planctomycetota bacterium]
AFSNFDSTDATGTLSGSGIETIALNGKPLYGTAAANNLNFDKITFTGLNYFSAGDIEVTTLDGDDTVFGTSQTGHTGTYNAPTDRVDYDLGAGNDTFTGSATAAKIDVVYGQAGTDTLSGLLGDDFLYGGGDNDTLLGGAGNDTLDGGQGIDFMDGGDGNDTFNVGAGGQSDMDTFLGGAGTDVIVNNAGAAFTLTTFDSTDATGTISGSGIDQINVNSNSIKGTAGDDSLNLANVSFLGINYFGAAGFEVEAGAGNDVIVGSALAGRTGTYNALTTRFDYDLGAGNDSFTGSATATITDVVYGRDGDDTISTGGGNDTI